MTPESLNVKPLSLQQRKALRELHAGCTTKEVAARLGISEGTARSHIRQLLYKLHLKTSVQLALYAEAHPELIRIEDEA
jgi:two-component system, NarL family, nitrate/nitrite response regulator NarL